MFTTLIIFIVYVLIAVVVVRIRIAAIHKSVQAHHDMCRRYTALILIKNL